MKKSTLGIIVGLIALLAIVGIVVANRPDNQKTASSNTTQPTTSANEVTPTGADENLTPDSSQNAAISDTNKVEISNFAFTPPMITVKKGTTVTWTNKDSAAHTVTPDEKTNDFKASGLLNQGQTHEVTFNTPGTFSYHCEPHPQMTGTVVVTE